MITTGIVLLTTGLVACSHSVTPNYYTLTPKVVPLVSSNIRVIEILPVGLPDRLNRTPLVLQESSGKVSVLDNERWSSTLAAELRDGLSAGLQQKLGAVDRYNSGMTGGKVAYRIATDFSRFDIVEQIDTNKLRVKANRNIEVAVAWTIKRDDTNQKLRSTTESSSTNQNPLLSCRMTFSYAVVNDTHHIQDVVNASRQSLSQVIDAVATSVNAVDLKTSPQSQGVTCS